ncbi:MAG: T9SS type A sorting domain-containing protein [Bacteroidetes bacterium]|nr:T9SS type A sorting domain-containing protein [Bacteroidota bacterium]
MDYARQKRTVSDAIASNEKTISTTGTQLFQETNVSLNVQVPGVTPSIVRVHHDFVAPDPFQQSNPGIRLSDYHYWTIEGIFKSGFHAKGTFLYNGSASATAGYLDNTLITGSEDSLVILYRPGSGYNWEVVQGYTLNTGPSVTDKAGSFTVDTLKTGEYTIGIYDYTVSVYENSEIEKSLMRISPNPSSTNFNIEFNTASTQNRQLLVFDMGGRQVYSTTILSQQQQVLWQAKNCNSGTYYIILMEGGKKISGQRVVLNK